MAEPLTIQCPHCQTQFSFQPVTLLTPEDSHEEELNRGTLNCVQCPECGKTLNVPVRLSFRDAEGSFLLVQEPRPLPEPEAAKRALQLDEAATRAALEKGIQRPVVRMVFTRPDFLEKLYLHQKSLDDRVVEFAKYQLFHGGTQDGALNPHRHRLLFDYSQSDAERMVFLVYDRVSGKPIRMLQVPRTEYDALAEEIAINPAIQKELDNCFPGCRVDVDQVFQALSRETK